MAQGTQTKADNNLERWDGEGGGRDSSGRGRG